VNDARAQASQAEMGHFPMPPPSGYHTFAACVEPSYLIGYTLP
jgi:hypothetical protein